MYSKLCFISRSGRISQPSVIVTRRVVIQFIEELDGFSRTGNPCRRASSSRFEVVRASAQELVTNVQRLAPLYTAKITLTSHHPPELISNINKNIISTLESDELLDNSEALRKLDVPLKAQKGSSLPAGDISTTC